MSMNATRSCKVQEVPEKARKRLKVSNKVQKLAKKPCNLQMLANTKKLSKKGLQISVAKSRGKERK